MATWATVRFLRRARRTSNRQPPITVLKPLHGLEPELYENLSSFCAQAYGGHIQIVLGANDPKDPALAVAAQVKAEHPDQDIVIVADVTLHGANRKVGNLINMSRHAAGEVIVISDSDVRLPVDGLSRIVGALRQPGVGLVHCYYRGRPAGNLWSRLAASIRLSIICENGVWFTEDDCNRRKASCPTIGRSASKSIARGGTNERRNPIHPRSLRPRAWRP